MVMSESFARASAVKRSQIVRLDCPGNRPLAAIPLVEGISAVVNTWRNQPQGQEAEVRASNWISEQGRCGILLDKESKYTLVLLRHGQSTWNEQNLFTGWTNVPLSPKGVAEARNAAVILSRLGYDFDLAFVSFLIRADQTLKIVLGAMGLSNIPSIASWALNERHYGALQGLNKADATKNFGEAQVKLWRRSYDVRPPPLDILDPWHPIHDPAYAAFPTSLLPSCESLKDTVARVLPYWKENIMPAITSGRMILVSAHGNSIRALVKHLDGISESEIAELNIPTGFPLVYEFGAGMVPLMSYYLGDPQEILAGINAVANQANGLGSTITQPSQPN